MVDSLPERPVLRHLETQQVDDGEQRGIVLSDPLGLCEDPVFVPAGLLPLVGRMDGERTRAAILAELRAEFGAVPDGAVDRIVGDLDERLLLLSPRFDAALAAASTRFADAGARPAAHAGSAGYPGDPDALRAALDSMVRRPAAPARPAPRGLVAPHIDLARGREGYAQAYGYLAECEPADLYVVFGTGHAGPSAPITGLALDWQTPLGTLATDRGYVAAVHDRIGAPASRDVLLHRHEHSIEFQMLLLAHVLAPLDHAFAVAGFLTGALPQEGGDPGAHPAVAAALDALRAATEASGKRVCYVAGADLAHIGPWFGDPEPVDAARLAGLADNEGARLAHLERGDPAAFHRAVEQPGNPDRVCGAAPIYLAASLAGGAGELLHYGQARSDDGAQTVSFCSVAFPG